METSPKGLFGGGEADQPQPATTGDKPRRRRERRQPERRPGRREGDRRRDRPRRAQDEDFVNRYLTGNPSEGFSSEEAVEHLRRVRQEASPEVLQRAAARTVEHLPPDQRAAFAEMLRRRQAGEGMVPIERAGGAVAAGPGGDPLTDLFGGLLGGIGGGTAAPPRGSGQGQGVPGLDDLLGGLLGGPANGTRRAPADGTDQGSGLGDLLGNPLTKAVLGGLAAFAMKELLDQDR